MKLLSAISAILLLSITASATPNKKIGIITSGSLAQRAETQAMANVLKKSGNYSVVMIPITDLKSISKCDAVWYHRPDSSAVSNYETKAGRMLYEYVSKGGALILSMDAVKLLNCWGIEPREIETLHYRAIDEGFGRKIGFHSYRGHPIFDRLYGGAYPWHGKVDNVCRMNGFTGNNLPLASGSKVIACEWEYIYNHPDIKLIWETPLGLGKILAIGGCLYYNSQNFHKQILDAFTLNCLNYMLGGPTVSSITYWDYSPVDVEKDSTQDSLKVSMIKPGDFNFYGTGDRLSHNAGSNYFDLATKRTMIVGNEAGGIEEIWTHPFMSLRDYQVRIDVNGDGHLISLSNLKPEFEIHPHAVMRHYDINGLRITEIISSTIDSPLTVIHYQWQNGKPNRIIVDFKSNLRYMWPYDDVSLGSIIYRWSSGLNAFIVENASREFISLVGSDVPGKVLKAGQYDGFSYSDGTIEGILTDKLQASCSIEYDTHSEKGLDIILCADNTGGEKNVFEQYSSALRDPSDASWQSAEYYKKYLNNTTSIITPDSSINEALRWALISSAQFIVSTPSIGTSLMAGYSSSRRGWGGGQKISGRPGYAWYFGRDAVWSGFAFDDYGDFETVRNILSTMISHQEIDGKIYHELTTSGFVHFDASDATPLFVTLMAHYLRASGNIQYIKSNIESVRKAMDYCYSTDTDGDGLIEISNVGHGWLEGGELFGSKTEFYLCGIWAQALKDAAYLSHICGDEESAIKYSIDASKVSSCLESFWNEKGYYNYGKRANGSYTDPLLVLTAVPIYFGTVDNERSRLTANYYSSPAMSTDWGVRTIPDTSKIGEEGAYGPRNVWPLFTGWAALAEYKTGLFNQGFSHICNNLKNYKGFALGRIPEVINGDAYRNNGITLHQCWSETMAIMPLFEGMLGFVPDAVSNSMQLSPHIPETWNFIEANRLRCGEVSIGFRMDRHDGIITYSFTSDAPIIINFTPSFPEGTILKKVSVNGKPTNYRSYSNHDNVEMALSIGVNGKCKIEVSTLR